MDLHERYSALIHPSRTRIFRLLCQEDLSGGEVARITQSPQSTTSRHLKLLTENGWVTNRRVGNSVIFSASKDLSAADEALWSALALELSDRWPDDALRLATTIHERSPTSRDYFGRLGARWEEVRRALYGEHSLTHLALSLLSTDLVIADLGCGSGGVSALLASQVKRVIGIDREPAMIEAAQAKTSQLDNVEIRHGELEAPPLSVSEVDIALFNLVLHLVESPTTALQAVASSLKSGGRVLIIDMVAHDRDEYRQTMGHISLGFSEEQLNSIALRAGLSVTRYRALPPDLDASGPALFAAILSVS